MPKLTETCVIVLVVGLFIAIGKSVDMNVWLLAVGSGVAAALAALVIEAVSQFMEKMEASERSIKAAAEEIKVLREGNNPPFGDQQFEYSPFDNQEFENPSFGNQQFVQVPSEYRDLPVYQSKAMTAPAVQNLPPKSTLSDVLRQFADDPNTSGEVQKMLSALAAQEQGARVPTEPEQTIPVGQVQGHVDQRRQNQSENVPTNREIAKQKALQNADKIKSGYPAHYQLRMADEFTNKQKMLRRLSYGPNTCTKPMKTILVVGATGAGKSTLINALANHLLGVDFDDNYRFRVVQEDINADQSASVTKVVTAYVFYHQDTFPDKFPCSLTIVDTPGFGDTQGIQEDEKIKEQLRHFFNGKGIEGIDALDAIGFVMQSSLARLTPTQRYIFHSILALFGRDVAENIFILATFADGQTPPVIAAIDADALPYTKCFKFNNSALFADREEAQKNDEVPFNEFFWVMGTASYGKFLNHVARAKTKTLTLTNQVLEERDRLQIRVSDLQQKIRMAFATSENLSAALDCFIKNQTDIETHKDFSFEIVRPKITTEKLDAGVYVTNCLKCNNTCHYPCAYNDDDDKYRCSAMSSGDRDSSCGICAGKCHWSQHKNNEHRYVINEEKETQTVQDMKAKYEEACQQRLSTEDVILKIIVDIELAETEIVSLVEEVREILERLSEIALRPDHMTTSGYIDILIQSEEQQATRGWQKRVEQLRAVRERAELIKSYSEFRGISHPYQALKKEIEEMKTKRKAGQLKEGGMIQSMTTWRDNTVSAATKYYRKFTGRNGAPQKTHQPGGRGAVGKNYGHQYRK